MSQALASAASARKRSRTARAKRTIANIKPRSEGAATLADALARYAEKRPVSVPNLGEVRLDKAVAAVYSVGPAEYDAIMDQARIQWHRERQEIRHLTAGELFRVSDTLYERYLKE